MSIDITSTAMTTASAPVSNNKVTQSGTDKASSDSSFKGEMEKVATNENKTTEKQDNVSKTQPEAKKADKSETKTDKTKSEAKKESVKVENQTAETVLENNNQVINENIAFNTQEAFTNANTMLQSDIAQMIENTVAVSDFKNNGVWALNFGDGIQNNLNVTETDAQFFLNLTQSNDVSARGIMTQAQNMLNSGVDSKQVAQNFKISQALLNALSEARQNNQPLRIDFDQNVAVILRFGKDGSIAANFIPGDKAVEQYLKSNIQSLRASFDEQNLPYSDLSYSNASKEQNRRRRNEQQGDK